MQQFCMNISILNFTAVASKSTLFDDPSQEIGELTDSIKQDITHLNQQIEVLQVNDLQWSACRCLTSDTNRACRDQKEEVTSKLLSILAQ